jgi:HD-like signal output (HDOD) protein
MNFDGIYNYYERLVYDEVMRLLAKQNRLYSTDDAEDIACIALNQCPSRYVRHSVDTAFFMSENEREEMESIVSTVVNEAFDRVKAHPGVPD